MTFTEEQVERYARHIILPEVGGDGQERLLSARVLVVGAGGLGSPVAMYLAAAGIGTLGIIDDDDVELTNLQRQILHTTEDLGRAKVGSAADAVRRLNPDVTVEGIEERFGASDARELVRGYDLVVDGSDNFPTRYLANDACRLEGVPLVHGAIFRFEGQVSTFDPRVPESPCYRCIVPDPPPPDSIPNCAQAGVLGVVAGVVGSLQAAEALKVLLGIGDPLVGRLLLYDAKEPRFTIVSVERDPSCVLCGDEPRLTSLIDYDLFCGVRG